MILYFCQSYVLQCTLEQKSTNSNTHCIHELNVSNNSRQETTQKQRSNHLNTLSVYTSFVSSSQLGTFSSLLWEQSRMSPWSQLHSRLGHPQTVDAHSRRIKVTTHLPLMTAARVRRFFCEVRKDMVRLCHFHMRGVKCSVLLWTLSGVMGAFAVDT